MRDKVPAQEVRKSSVLVSMLVSTSLVDSSRNSTFGSDNCSRAKPSRSNSWAGDRTSSISSPLRNLSNQHLGDPVVCQRCQLIALLIERR